MPLRLKKPVKTLTEGPLDATDTEIADTANTAEKTENGTATATGRAQGMKENVGTRSLDGGVQPLLTLPLKKQTCWDWELQRAPKRKLRPLKSRVLSILHLWSHLPFLQRKPPAPPRLCQKLATKRSRVLESRTPLATGRSGDSINMRVRREEGRATEKGAIITTIVTIVEETIEGEESMTEQVALTSLPPFSPPTPILRCVWI